MKKVSFLLITLLAVFVTSLSVVAFAASNDENPYKNHYVKEARQFASRARLNLFFSL